MNRKRKISVAFATFTFLFFLVCANLTAATLNSKEFQINYELQKININLLNMAYNSQTPEDTMPVISKILTGISAQKQLNEARAMYNAGGDYIALSTQALTMAKNFAAAGNFEMADKYLEKSKRFGNLAGSLNETSFVLVTASEEIGKSIALYNAAKNGAFLAVGILTAGTVGPGTAILVDVAKEIVSLEMDYLVDRDTLSEKEAKRNAISNAIVSIFTAGFAEVTGLDQVIDGAWTKKSTDLAVDFLNSPEFKKVVTQELVGSELTKEASNTILGKLANYALDALDALATSEIYNTNNEFYQGSITIVQNQNDTNTSNNPPVGDRPTAHIGNFTRVVTERDNVSHTGFQLLISNIDTFNTIHDLGSAITINTNPESSYDADLSRITAMEIDRTPGPDQYPSITGGLPAIINKVELGHDGYMEWGYWTASNVLTYTSTPSNIRDYRFDNRNYWIWGDVTSNAQMNSLAVNNIAGTYTGTAMGTFWTAGGGANMSGSFNSHVNFNTKTVSDFNLSVSGGGHTAAITNASGTFSGSSSSFTVNGSTGQWKVDGVSAAADRVGANGAVYGTNGKAIGGTWLISPSDSAIAYGIYRGTR